VWPSPGLTAMLLTRSSDEHPEHSQFMRVRKWPKSYVLDYQSS
jgi:hypothetical protein